MIHWVDIGLNEWARWLERSSWSRLGYPTQSTTYRMMRERGRLSKRPRKGQVAKRFMREYEALDGKKRKETVRHMVPIQPPKQSSGWGRWDAEILWPSHIERIDTCVQQLPEQEKTLVRVHYIEDGPAREKAKALGMGKSRYYDLLAAIHRRIADEFDAA